MVAEPFRRMCSVADSQHGVITRSQALDAGISRHALAHLTRSLRLRRVLPAVYVVGLGELGGWTRAAAATLYVGPGSALARGSAAAALGLLEWPDRTQVVHTTRHRHETPGLALRWTRGLPKGDVIQVRGVPVTSPLRTILDLADTLDPVDLADLAARAHRQRLVSTTQLRRRLQSEHRDPYTAFLREMSTLNGAADSGVEVVLARGLRRAGEDVVLNLEVVAPSGRRRRGDIVLRRWRVVVQVDSERYHSGRAAQDMQRDLDWVGLGYRVIRVSAKRIRQELATVVAEILLAAVRPPDGRHMTPVEPPRGGLSGIKWRRVAERGRPEWHQVPRWHRPGGHRVAQGSRLRGSAAPAPAPGAAPARRSRGCRPVHRRCGATARR
jgi:hypothetical protein